MTVSGPRMTSMRCDFGVPLGNLGRVGAAFRDGFRAGLLRLGGGFLAGLAGLGGGVGSGSGGGAMVISAGWPLSAWHISRWDWQVERPQVGHSMRLWKHKGSWQTSHSPTSWLHCVQHPVYAG